MAEIVVEYKGGPCDGQLLCAPQLTSIDPETVYAEACDLGIDATLAVCTYLGHVADEPTFYGFATGVNIRLYPQLYRSAISDGELIAIAHIYEVYSVTKAGGRIVVRGQHVGPESEVRCTFVD